MTGITLSVVVNAAHVPATTGMVAGNTGPIRIARNRSATSGTRQRCLVLGANTPSAWLRGLVNVDVTNVRARRSFLSVGMVSLLHQIVGYMHSVEKIKAAYALIGMVPTDKTFLHGRSCCALTAIYLAEGGSLEALKDVLEDGSYPAYASSLEAFDFILGFDGHAGSSEAWRLGKEARRAILGK